MTTYCDTLLQHAANKTSAGISFVPNGFLMKDYLVFLSIYLAEGIHFGGKLESSVLGVFVYDKMSENARNPILV